MQAANRHTPGREVTRKETLESAKRSCAYHKHRPGGEDSTIWIDLVHRPGTDDEDYERIGTYYDGGL
jgi:hypothetical protein